MRSVPTLVSVHRMLNVGFVYIMLKKLTCYFFASKKKLGAIFLFSSIVFVTACGQKGALYLPDFKATVKKNSESDLLVPPQKGRVTTTLLSLESLNIGGKLAQLNHENPQGWLALLSTPVDSKDNLRYVVFDGDILGKTSPLTVLVGQVQNKALKSDNSQRTLNAGTYLRVRSLETGVTYLPALMAKANEYFVAHPNVKRKTHVARTDFLIESQKNIDLYLSVEPKQ